MSVDEIWEKLIQRVGIAAMEKLIEECFASSANDFNNNNNYNQETEDVDAEDNGNDDTLNPDKDGKEGDQLVNRTLTPPRQELDAVSSDSIVKPLANSKANEGRAKQE